MAKKMQISLTVNGEAHDILTEPRELLILVLREKLGLTGPHIGCETSHCGACTVDMNGKSVKACTVLAAQADGATITTIEGWARPTGCTSCSGPSANTTGCSAATARRA